MHWTVLKVRGREVIGCDNVIRMANSQVKAAFGRHVREMRKKNGWSQEHLADLVGLDRSYVGGVERGERNVSLENIAKFAQALRLTLSQLMDFEHG